MRNYLSLLAISFIIIHSSSGQRQRAPMYYSAYAYLYTINSNQPTELYMEEDLWKHNIDYISENLAPLGFDIIATDGWGEAQKDDNGFLVRHHPTWDSSYSEWSVYSNQIGVKIGMYDNPLWINSEIESTKHLMDSTAGDVWFNWIKINEPQSINGSGDTLISAREHMKRYIEYYANDIQTDYLRVDFLSWYEDGIDKSSCYTVESNRPIEDYQKALGYLNDFCDSLDIQLSLVMPHLYNNAATEKEYAPGSMIRINEDATHGGWDRLSDLEKGNEHQIWSKYHNTFDGLTYWSIVSGFDDSNGEMILDGDFIWLSSFEDDDEKKAALSINLVAGGAIALTEYYIEDIASSMHLLENDEVFTLNREGFVGKPIDYDWESSQPIDPNDIVNISERWAGKMANGDFIVCLFNRDTVEHTKSVDFDEIYGYEFDSVKVRDLWARQDFGGYFTDFDTLLPPHSCVMLRLKSPTNSCSPQNISFNAISGKTGDSHFFVNAYSDSGLPVNLSLSKGRGSVIRESVDSVFKVTLESESGLFELVASQPGDSIFCPAESVIQQFSVAGQGYHEPEMFIGGTFNGWSPGNYRMRLQNEVWTIQRVYFEAGVEYGMKFVNNMEYQGKLWGQSNGMTGAATLLSGQDDNVVFTVDSTGYYGITFDDFTLGYAISLEENGVCVPQTIDFAPIGDNVLAGDTIDLTEFVTLDQDGQNRWWKVNFEIKEGGDYIDFCRKKLAFQCKGRVVVEAIYNGSDVYCPAKMEQTINGNEIKANEEYSIVSKLSRERYNTYGGTRLRALDLFESSAESGTNIHQWEYFPALETQHWEVKVEDDCVYSMQIKNESDSVFAIDVEGESLNDGGNIHLWEYYDEGEHDNQKWRIEWVTSEIEYNGYTQITRNYFKIISKHSQKAIDIYQGLEDNGTNIHQWEYFGGSSQLWEFVPVSSSGSRVDVSHEPIPTNAFNIYPNPTTTNGKLYLRNDFESMRSVNMTITDMSGNIKHQEMIKIGSEATLDLTIAPGLYVVVLDHDGKRESHKVLIEQ